MQLNALPIGFAINLKVCNMKMYILFSLQECKWA